MVSLNIDYVSPVEVFVERVTRPCDGKHFFLDLYVSRFCIGKGIVTNGLALLQQYSR